MRNLSAGRDGQLLAGGPPRIRGRAGRKREPDTAAMARPRPEQLPALLKTAKANAFPKAEPTSKG
jgi:hypothetical protein